MVIQDPGGTPLVSKQNTLTADHFTISRLSFVVPTRMKYQPALFSSQAEFLNGCAGVCKQMGIFTGARYQNGLVHSTSLRSYQDATLKNIDSSNLG
jgi:hypothetical protein